MLGSALTVMVSSTGLDLAAERMAAGKAIERLGMASNAMEHDSAVDRGELENSYRKVQAADFYILIQGSTYYGQIILDATLNPDGVSVTEREFEWASARTPTLPILIFQQDEGVTPPVHSSKLKQVTEHQDKQVAFRTRVRNHQRITATFKTAGELAGEVTHALNEWLRDHPHHPAAPPDQTGIPVPLPDLCHGRGPDTDRIVAALIDPTAPHPAILLRGPGGIGKTTLTQQAANHDDVIARFANRRWFIALETATDRDTFDAQLLLGLGLDPSQGFAAAIARLTQAPTLLILDNLETSWERSGPVIEARLRDLLAIPNLALLASFRGQEAVRARWTLRHRVDPLSEDAAKTLFLEIAETIEPTDPHLPRFLAALGGVPLAICLTARRAARHATLAALWADWKRLGPAVSVWANTDLHRLTSVPASIALSLQSSRMNPPAHRLFALLGQCPAGLASADRAALLGTDAARAEEALIAVGLALHRGDRLDLLPPVRDHARHTAKPEGGDATSWCRHFLERARDEGERIGNDGGAEALAALTPEVANIDAALRAAPALALRDQAVTALNGVYRLLSASGAGSPAMCDPVAQACIAADDPSGQAEALFYHGLVSFDRSDNPTAQARCEEARPLYQRVGNVLGEANCLSGFGDVARETGDRPGAKAHFEAALAIYERIHRTYNVALAHERLAAVTAGAEQAEHVRAARDAWLSIGLPDRAAGVTRRFG